jgi:hypothetical protein
MGSGTAVAAPVRRDDLQDEFLGLVYADDEFVQVEFDALIADGWGDGHEVSSDGDPADPATTPPGRTDPQPAISTRMSRFADPLIGRFSRQRSPLRPLLGDCGAGEAPNGVESVASAVVLPLCVPLLATEGDSYRVREAKSRGAAASKSP